MWHPCPVVNSSIIMAAETKKKWKRFEELAAEIQKDLSPQAEVALNQHLMGKRSNQSRQIDIVVKQKIGQFDILIVIDCKDYKHPLDVREVESFIGMVEDVGANKGALISVKGFTKAAKTRAKDSGINLYSLLDAKNEEWGSFVTALVLVRDLQLKAYSVTFEAVPFKEFCIKPQKIDEMSLFHEDGTFIDYIRNLVLDRWEDETIPPIPGTHNKIPITGEDVWTRVDEKLYNLKVYVNAVVVEELRFGNLPIVDIRGFKDDVHGGILTKGFTTDFLDFEKISKEWPVILSEEALAVRPVFALGVVSSYPRLAVRVDPNLI